jgi:hypothetical protein
VTEEIVTVEKTELESTKAPEPVAGEVPVNGAVPRHLVTKLARVLGALERVPKGGYNKDQEYYFVRETDVCDVVRRELAKVGAFVFTTIQSYSREPAYVTNSGKQMWLFKLWATFTFLDGESSEQWQVHFPGEALDFGDKGLYKAITGATKYMLMKTFLLSSGDDPENDSHGEEKPAPPKVEPGKRPQRKPSAPAVEPQIIEGKVGQAVQLESKTGKPYVAVFIRKIRYTTFDKKLFPALLASTEKQIRLRVHEVTRGGRKFPEILTLLAPAEGVPSPSSDITDGPWSQAPPTA